MKKFIAAVIACLAFSVLPAAGTVYTQDAGGAWTASEDKAIVDSCVVYRLANGNRIETYGAGSRSEVFHFHSSLRLEMSYNGNGGEPNAYLYHYAADGSRTSEKFRGEDARELRAALLALAGR